MAALLFLALFFPLLPLAAAAGIPGQHERLLAPAVPPPPRLYDRMADLVVRHGYPLEEHFVETVDGYILRLFRIPHGRKQQSSSSAAASASAVRSRLSGLLHWHSHAPTAPGPAASHREAAATHGGRASSSRRGRASRSRSRRRLAAAGSSSNVPRPVVHLQHGLLGSSTDWVLNGPGLSLPLLLADAGYDVWLGNVRGNIFSRNHTTLGLLDPLFWAFSWDEMAARDLPAMLTKELMVSGAADLAYVGHSQGTTIGMAFLASHAGSELAQRVKVAVLLAPVAFVTHVDSIPLTTLATLNTDEIFVLLGINEFLPSSEVMSRLEGQLCKYQPALCVNLLAAICGYNPSNLDTDRLPTYLNYTPSGTSVKNMAHWSQAVRQTASNVMRYYDYGVTCRSLLGLPQPCNQAVYGELVPPTYNLSAITNKLVLFTGQKDRLGDPADTLLLLNVLPRDRIILWQLEPEYEHLDFIWGINAAEKLYSKVLDVLGQLGCTCADVRAQV